MQEENLNLKSQKNSSNILDRLKKSVKIEIVGVTIIVLVIFSAIIMFDNASDLEVVFEEQESGVVSDTSMEATEEHKVEKEVTGAYRNDSVLNKYIIDADAIHVLLPSLQEKSDINPQFLCQEIIATKETRNSIYFYVIDEYGRLNNQYGAYSISIKDIGADLTSIQGLLQFIKEECTSKGYSIDFTDTP